MPAASECRLEEGDELIPREIPLLLAVAAANALELAPNISDVNNAANVWLASSASRRK